MWEWSFKKKNNSSKASLINAYEGLMVAKTAEFVGRETFSQAEMLSILEKKLEYYNLNDTKLVEKHYLPQTWKEMIDSFQQYGCARKSFLKMLFYNHKKECLSAGISAEDLTLLNLGIAPENFNIHLKTPFDFGGKAEFSNFCFMRSHPTHDCFHAILDFQIENSFLAHHKKIFIPLFEGKIYHG